MHDNWRCNDVVSSVVVLCRQHNTFIRPDWIACRYRRTPEPGSKGKDADKLLLQHLRLRPSQSLSRTHRLWNVAIWVGAWFPIDVKVFPCVCTDRCTTGHAVKCRTFMIARSLVWISWLLCTNTNSACSAPGSVSECQQNLRSKRAYHVSTTPVSLVLQFQLVSVGLMANEAEISAALWAHKA